MNIGFFDSGLGGLLVLKAVAKALPQYDYIYYGDTAHLPYGDKSEGEIYEYTKAAITELFNRGCALVIVACNTASAETIRKLQDTYLKDEYPDRKILGVIVPTIETVIEHGYEKVLLLATNRTVASGKYERELKKISATTELISVAAPQLVPLLESHNHEMALREAITLINTHVATCDAVILGCTHYSLLKDDLREQFKNQPVFISQDEVIPHKLEQYLEKHEEIRQRLTNTGKREIILSAHRPDYDRLTAEFLGGVYLPE